MLKPLHDNVVLAPLEAEERTAGGIVLPDSAQEKQARGQVVAVGPGRLLKDGRRGPMSVKVGDRVITSKYGGTEVKLGNKRYLILGEDDIYAVEEAETAPKPARRASRAKGKTSR